MLEKKPRRRFLFDLFTATFFSGVYSAALYEVNSQKYDWINITLFLLGVVVLVGMIWVEIVIPSIDMIFPAKTVEKTVLRHWWLICMIIPIPLSLVGPSYSQFLLREFTVPGWENRVGLPSLIGLLFWEIRLYRQYKKLPEPTRPRIIDRSGL